MCIKKRLRPAEQERPDVAEKRRKFRTWMKRVDATRLVFLDESGANTKMGRSHAWTRKGKERIDSRPMNWGKNLTMTGAIRSNGTVLLRTQFNPATSKSFANYFRQLAEKLRPGDIVIMDNARVHYAASIKATAKASKIRVKYLPPYSPDFNPIEPAWANTKRFMKKFAARTSNALRLSAKTAFRKVTPEHCKAWMRKSGYKI